VPLNNSQPHTNASETCSQRLFGGHRRDIRIGPLSQAHCGIARPDLVASPVVSATEIRILEITARLTRTGSESQVILRDSCLSRMVLTMSLMQLFPSTPRTAPY
jgi:hypothetical protein